MQVTEQELIGQKTEVDVQAQQSAISVYEADSIYSAIGYKKESEKAVVSSPIIEEKGRMPGIIAATLGALAAGVAWILIGYSGLFIEGLSVWILIIAITLYGKFVKMPDTLGSLFCSVLATVEAVVAIYLYYGLWITKEMGKAGKSVSVWWVYRRLPDYLDRFDLWEKFIERMIIGVLLSVLMMVCMAIKYIKERRSKEISQKTQTSKSENNVAKTSSRNIKIRSVCGASCGIIITSVVSVLIGFFDYSKVNIILLILAVVRYPVAYGMGRLFGGKKGWFLTITSIFLALITYYPVVYAHCAAVAYVRLHETIGAGYTYMTAWEMLPSYRVWFKDIGVYYKLTVGVGFIFIILISLLGILEEISSDDLKKNDVHIKVDAYVKKKQLSDRRKMVSKIVKQQSKKK